MPSGVCVLFCVNSSSSFFSVSHTTACRLIPANSDAQINKGHLWLQAVGCSFHQPWEQAPFMVHTAGWSYEILPRNMRKYEENEDPKVLQKDKMKKTKLAAYYMLCTCVKKYTIFAFYTQTRPLHCIEAPWSPVLLPWCWCGSTTEDQASDVDIAPPGWESVVMSLPFYSTSVLAIAQIDATRTNHLEQNKPESIPMETHRIGGQHTTLIKLPWSSFRIERVSTVGSVLCVLL